MDGLPDFGGLLLLAFQYADKRARILDD